MTIPLRTTLALLALLATCASAQAPALPPEDNDPPIAPVDVHNHDHEPIRRIEVPDHINQVTDALRELISAARGARSCLEGQHRLRRSISATLLSSAVWS